MPLEEAIEKVDGWLAERFVKRRNYPVNKLARLEWLKSLTSGYMGEERFALAEQKYAEMVQILSQEKGPHDRDTFEARFNLTTAIIRQGRDDDAQSALEEILPLTRQYLGEGDTLTLEAAKRLAAILRDQAWRKSRGVVEPEAVRKEAVALAERALSLDQAGDSSADWFVLGWAAYRDQDYAKAADAMDHFFDLKTSSVSQWLLESLVQWQLGNKEVATAWFRAASEWIVRSNSSGEDVVLLRTEASRVLGLGTEWPPSDWTPADEVELYSRLIAVRPLVPRLYHYRGTHYGHLGDWPHAAEDYARARELDPKNWYSLAELAVIRLYQGDTVAFESLCSEALRDFAALPDYRAEVARLCALVPRPDVDMSVHLESLDRNDNAPSALSSRVIKGMVLYRAGRSAEALEVLPGVDAEFGNPIDRILCLSFRAMAHRQLRDFYTSDQLLQRFRRVISDDLRGPDDAIVPFQNHPVMWCLAQTVLREVEQVVAPVTEKSTEPDVAD